MAFTSVMITINDHTTASSPRPHVIYLVNAVAADGKTTRVAKRYSDELHLKDALPSTLSRKAALEVQLKLAAAASTPIAAVYYPDWSADSWLPESLDYSKFNILFFGGWGGSYYFSQAVSSAYNHSMFVNAAVSAVNPYGLDGEHQQTADVILYASISTGLCKPPNLLDLSRSALGSSKIISAAVTQEPFLGVNGSPLTNVASYAEQLTYINIMNYNVWGASSTPGPNAPLGNLCGTSQQPQVSAEAAFAQLTAAGFPANKMLLGLPLYRFNIQKYMEHVLGVPTRNPVPMCPLVWEAFKEKPNFLEGKHDRTKQKQKTIEVEAGNGDLSSYYGQQIVFNQIVALGALLTKLSSGTYVQANGYTEGWDDCSDTPQYNLALTTSHRTVVPYNDTYSLNNKAAYAKQAGMAGTMIWLLDQDNGYTLQTVMDGLTSP
ncbi:glycoside hydrolase superfamily [Cytidiella melzeri]|nr:glycoside hydrolase superfamily [Cytidiella melzeri]